MKTTPKASVVDATRPDVRTVYRVDGVQVGGEAKSYRVVTYPNSDLVFVENYETGRVVSAGVARRLIPVLKAAVADLVAEVQRQRADPMLADGMMNVDVDGKIERRPYTMKPIPASSASAPGMRAEPELQPGEWLIWHIGSGVPILCRTE